MPKQRKILFISAPVGAGHIRAAQAVANALQAIDPTVITQLANVFDFFNPFLGRIILKIYLRILVIFPKLYGVAYGWGNASLLALWGRKLISSYLAARMYRYILTFQPDAIICTHATPAGLVAYLLKKGDLKVPAFAVITDFIVHRLWVYPELGRYYVADESLRSFLAENHIALNQSQAFGIPVDSDFSVEMKREEVMNKLGIRTEGKVVLLMGGGTGILPVEEILAACDTLKAMFQFIVVTGNNQKMLNKLQQYRKQMRHPLLSLGFVSNVHELMAIADILISKPGGLTSAEALASGLPMIIFNPLPGQEEANTQFLLQRHFAIRANTPAELQSILYKLLVEDSEELTSLRASVRHAGRPHAARYIAEDITRVLHDRTLK